MESRFQQCSELIRGDHLPLSMVTRETAECRGRTLPECQTSWVSTGASHFLMLFNSKKHNFQSVSGPRECMVQVPLQNPATTGTVEKRPQDVPWLVCLSVAVSRTNGVQWMGLFFLTVFYAQLLKMTEDFSFFDSICVIFIFQFFKK